MTVIVRYTRGMALPHLQRLNRPPSARDHGYYVRVANDTAKQRQWNSARCMERRYALVLLLDISNCNMSLDTSKLALFLRSSWLDISLSEF